MLDFIDKTFDQMALAVDMKVVVTRRVAIGTGWNDWDSLSSRNQVDKVVGIVRPISDKLAKGETVGQGQGLCDVVALTSGQPQPKRIPQGIDTDWRELDV